MTTRGPQLNGTHYRITIVGRSVFLNITRLDDGSLLPSGYLIDILEIISQPDLANFSYELLTPSGHGSMCEKPVLADDDNNNATLDNQEDDYSERYFTAYNCAVSDVTDLPKTNYTTDMYFGLFYVTKERLLLNRFTSPYNPPRTGAIIMYGTATNIIDIPDYMQQQLTGKQTSPACVQENTAYATFLQQSFPTLKVVGIEATFEGHFSALHDGLCQVIFVPYPMARAYISMFYETGNCHVDGNPIGIIGNPLDFGPSRYAIGVRKDLPMDFVDAWNYWLNSLMECSPTCNLDDGCKNRHSLAALYTNTVGTGNECGYEQFPPTLSSVTFQGVLGGAAGIIVLVIIICSIVYYILLRRQQKRYKKRFVQQIARNISIGPEPGDIPVQKLAEEVQHIGDTNGNISKEDLFRWLNDVKLTFLSQEDYEALWAAIDVKNGGTDDKVNAIDFFVFLTKCGPEFKEVHEEEKQLSKIERLKLAARRLSNIQNLGEEGVRKLENNIERKARMNVQL